MNHPMKQILLGFWLAATGMLLAAGALNSDNARLAERLAQYEGGRAPANVIGLRPLAKAPVIDGVVEEGEWEAASGISAMRDFASGKLLPSRASMLLRGGHDAENLYFLVLVPGELPKVPRRTPDSMEIFQDGAVAEFLFAPEGARSACRIAVSAAGTMTDMRGADTGFESGAVCRVGAKASAKWIRACGWGWPCHLVECRVPRAALGLTNKEFRFNLFVTENGRQATLAPVRNSASEVEHFVRVRLLPEGGGFLGSGLGNPADGTFGIAGVLLPGPQETPDARLEVLAFRRGSRFREDTGYDEIDGALDIFSRQAKGFWRRLKYQVQNPQCDWFELTLRVDGQVLQRLNGPLTPRPPLALAVRNFPSRRRLEVRTSGTVAGKVALEAVDASGKSLWRQEVALQAVCALDYAGWAPGTYRVRATAGRFSTSAVFRVRGSDPWTGNALGQSEEILPGFEPLAQDGRSFRMWGRAYEWRDASLLFSARNGAVAPRLTLGGAPFRLASFEVVRSTPAAAEVVLAGRAGEARAHGRMRLEYDGLAWFDLVVEAPEGPHGELALETELDARDATLFHGAPLRTLNGYVPNGRKAYPWQIYFWVGNPVGGLGFVNESREPFTTAEEAAFETVKEGGKVRFRVRFREAGAFRQAKLSFGLQLTPVKPMPPHSSCIVTDDWGHRQGDKYPGLAKWMDFTVIWPRRCDYLPRICDLAGIRLKPLADAVRSAHQDGVDAMPYFAPISFTVDAQPELADYYEEWIQTPARTWKSGQTLQVRCCVASGYLDYLIWHLDRIQRGSGCDGFYFDGAWPVACDNALHGCGYVDAHGVRRPTYAVRKVREYLRRSATVAWQNNRRAGRQGKAPYQMWLHISGAVAPPMHSFASALFAGEWFKQSIKAGAHYDTLLTIERFIPRYIGQPWGIPSCFLSIVLDHEVKQYTDGVLAYVIPHGTGLYPRYLDLEQVKRVLAVKEAFGCRDARFHPPGALPSALGLRLDPKAVAAGAWENADGVCLVALGNCTSHEQTAQFDAGMHLQPLLGRARLDGTRITLPPNSLQLLRVCPRMNITDGEN